MVRIISFLGTPYKCHNTIFHISFSCIIDFVFNCPWLITCNVSSISGVHYRDNTNLCNKFHITYRAYRNYVVHDMIIRCYIAYFLGSINV